MSLILAYHNENFGVVCTDGRVSIRLPDGNQVASPGEVGRKSAALKPDLILAGSSSWSFELDYYTFDRMRELVHGNPTLSFAEIASAIPEVVASAYTLFPIPPETKINLILLGYDDRICVSRAGGAYDARDRSLNRKFLLGRQKFS